MKKMKQKIFMEDLKKIPKGRINRRGRKLKRMQENLKIFLRIKGILDSIVEEMHGNWNEPNWIRAEI